MSIALVAIVVESHGHAQEEPTEPVAELAAEGKPWSTRVPAVQQKRARALFLEGNELSKQYIFDKASEKYRKALEIFEHPAILFNLAVAEVNQKQPVAAREYLVEALRHEPSPIGKVKYEQGRTLLKALESQLARIEVSCETPGAEVMLNNEQLFVGPGKETRFVRAGGHRVSATKPGYIPEVRSLALSSEQEESVVLDLLKIGEVRTERLMRGWIPWTIGGSGLVLIAAGGFLDGRARSEFRTYDIDFIEQCEPRGCLDNEVSNLTDMRINAERQRVAGLSLYAVGSVALIAGTVLLVLNQERLIRDGIEGMDGMPAVELTRSPGGAVIQVRTRF